jgi:hypothetical protein
MLNIL